MTACSCGLYARCPRHLYNCPEQAAERDEQSGKSFWLWMHPNAIDVGAHDFNESRTGDISTEFVMFGDDHESQ